MSSWESKAVLEVRLRGKSESTLMVEYSWFYVVVVVEDALIGIRFDFCFFPLLYYVGFAIDVLHLFYAIDRRAPLLGSTGQKPLVGSSYPRNLPTSLFVRPAPGGKPSKRVPGDNSVPALSEVFLAQGDSAYDLAVFTRLTLFFL